MPISKQSPAAAKQKREVAKAYRIISETQPHCCANCGSPVYERSHNYSQGAFKWLAAHIRNITRLCREDHDDFENNRLIFISEEIIGRMVVLHDSEPDLYRKEKMRQHLYNKLCLIETSEIEKGNYPPEWIKPIKEKLEAQP